MTLQSKLYEMIAVLKEVWSLQCDMREWAEVLRAVM
jgi:hypothetical protein